MMMKRLLTILCIPAVLLLLGGPSEGYAFDELSLKKLLAMNRCAKCDLSGANLKWANLFKTNLTDVDLTNTELGKTKLTSAILCRTKVAWGVENRDCK